MKFIPKSEEEVLQNENLLTPNVYTFDILNAEDKSSRASNNEMIELKLRIYETPVKYRIIFDYLTEGMKHKLRHFAITTDLIDKYNSGEISANDCIGKRGEAFIDIKTPQIKDDGSSYPSKNYVKDYAATKCINPVLNIQQNEIALSDFIDDSIPF